MVNMILKVSVVVPMLEICVISVSQNMLSLDLRVNVSIVLMILDTISSLLPFS